MLTIVLLAKTMFYMQMVKRWHWPISITDQGLARKLAMLSEGLFAGRGVGGLIGTKMHMSPPVRRLSQ